MNHMKMFFFFKMVVFLCVQRSKEMLLAAVESNMLVFQNIDYMSEFKTNTHHHCGYD